MMSCAAVTVVQLCLRCSTRWWKRYLVYSPLSFRRLSSTFLVTKTTVDASAAVAFLVDMGFHRAAGVVRATSDMLAQLLSRPPHFMVLNVGQPLVHTKIPWSCEHSLYYFGSHHCASMAWLRSRSISFPSRRRCTRRFCSTKIGVRAGCQLGTQ